MESVLLRDVMNKRETFAKELRQCYEHRNETGLVPLSASYKDFNPIIRVGCAKGIKRSIDVVVSAVMLVLTAPLLFLIALLIKFTDKGPILFWQARVGLWGHEFPLPKFRSMVKDAEKLKDSLLPHSDHEKSITFKMKLDPRVTWIGRLIRKTSLDELPQLWCVLKGDMSLVGPRPPVPGEVVRYTFADFRRLSAKPGLTCIWQVSGRGDVPFEKQVVLDVQYIESQSLWLDLVLLLRTIPAVVSCNGAY